MKLEAPISLKIAQTTLGPGGYPRQSLGAAFLLNITVVTSGSGTVTFQVWDDSGTETDFAVTGGNYGLFKRVWVSQYAVTGNGLTITAALTWPIETPPEAIAISAPISITGTVNTDVGQGTQAAGNTTLAYGGTLIDPRQNTQVGVTSNGRVTGSAGTGDTGVGVGATDTLLYSLANSSASSKVFIIPVFVGSYGSATGSGGAQVTIKKLMTTGTTKWTLASINFTVAASTTYYFSIGGESGVSGTSTELYVSLPLNQPVVLLPGETLYVYGSSGVNGSVACNSDYYSEPL